jgi:hypothetical protein
MAGASRKTLAIDATQNEPSTLFRLLISALLFSTRINHNVALKSARILFECGWTIPEQMAASTWEQRVQALDEGRLRALRRAQLDHAGRNCANVPDLYQGICETCVPPRKPIRRKNESSWISSKALAKSP